MTNSDKWLLDRAKSAKEKAKAASADGRPLLKTLPPVDGLWGQLQAEARRQAAVYTEALGDPNAVKVTTTADTIEVSVPDGRRLTLQIDLKRRKLTERFRDQVGGVRMRRPMIGFVRDADGNAAFNFGGLHGACGSLLRRLIG